MIKVFSSFKQNLFEYLNCYQSKEDIGDLELTWLNNLKKSIFKNELEHAIETGLSQTTVEEYFRKLRLPGRPLTAAEIYIESDLRNTTNTMMEYYDKKFALVMSGAYDELYNKLINN